MSAKDPLLCPSSSRQDVVKSPEVDGAPETEPFYSIAEFADDLGVCTKTVRRWIADGRLPVHRFGRLLRISATDRKAFISSAQQPKRLPPMLGNSHER
jgi:excisionase family DNA binding protein